MNRRAPADPRAHWDDGSLPEIRREAHYGDRLVRCFVERAPTLYRMFQRAVERRGGHAALISGDRRWSWLELSTRVDALAAALAARGVAAGDRVALFVGNRPEFVVALFATQKLGAITVPIGTREQRPGLAYMLSQCGARAVLFDAALAGRVPDAGEVPSLMLRVAITDDADLPAGTGALPGRAIHDTDADFHALMRSGCAPVQPAGPAEEDTAVILYTSGTTGHPKGAMLTHLSIGQSSLHFVHGMRLSADDRSVLVVPASHVTGLVAIIAAMTQVGGSVVMLPEFNAARFLDAMTVEQATHTILVPAMYNLCLLQPDFAGRDLRRWRIAGFGGAPMPRSTIETLGRLQPQMVLVNAYGATETTSPATMMPLGQNTAHADSVGVPLPCADLLVVDDNGRELPAGEPGEIWIGGPMVVAGYWDNPEATRQSFTGGYWHSGDIGLIDDQGFVQVFDRKKDMLNRGGFKIYSVEVENTLLAVPGVVEAAVIGRPCPVLGERVHAFVCAPEVELAPEMLRAHCAQRLADYKVPETWTLRREPLPRNANGKLLKRVLRDQLG